MKSPLAVALCVPLAALLSGAAGCAEDEMEARPIVYPVGVSTAGARAADAPPVAAATTPPPPPPYVPSGDVVIGADDEAEPAEPDPAEGEAEPPPPDEEQAPPVADTDPSALGAFHATLDPYGAWEDDPTYGTVWVPSPGAVGQDFTPYVSGGHWAYDDDYTWVSDYAWGWAPFHYGRWVYGPRLGWAWIPGRTYAGAWVSWRYGWDDWAYVGWAPLAPTWCWRHGVAVGLGAVPAAPYAFVATGDLFARGIGGHVVSGTRAGFIAAHTRPWVAPAASNGGRVLARPAVSGPPPSALRIPDRAVAHVAADGGVLRARAFAQQSPVAVGGGGVSSVGRAVTGSVVGAGYAAGASTPRTAGAYAPAYGPPAPSHFGGRLGAGFVGAPAAAPVRIPARAAPSYAPSSPRYGAPVYSGGGRVYSRGSVSAGATLGGGGPYAPRPYFAASPASPASPQPMRAAPMPQVSAPAAAPMRAAPQVAAPAVRGFSGGAPASAGGFRGGGGYSVGATVRAAPRAGGRR